MRRMHLVVVFGPPAAGNRDFLRLDNTDLPAVDAAARIASTLGIAVR